MESTDYEPLRRPGGDMPLSNGGTRSSGKTFHKVKVLQTGGSGSLKSGFLHTVGRSARNSRGNSRRELQEEMTVVQSPVFFHLATPGSKPGVRKNSPVALVFAQFSDMVRNVRQRPIHISPHDIIHLDPHPENTFAKD